MQLPREVAPAGTHLARVGRFQPRGVGRPGEPAAVDGRGGSRQLPERLGRGRRDHAAAGAGIGPPSSPEAAPVAVGRAGLADATELAPLLASACRAVRLREPQSTGERRDEDRLRRALYASARRFPSGDDSGGGFRPRRVSCLDRVDAVL
ncbi:MAG: hypothetical protein KY433_12490, partial [Actinobacteria bacterium]|nr:hypothetical protein [Actinomycetota bacterium]